MADTGGLAASIRQQLDAGKAPEDVIQDLVASGLSQASAERFVDRAIATGASAPAPPPAVPAPDANPEDPDPATAISNYLRSREVAQAHQTQQAFRELTQGSVAMTAGIVLTLVSLGLPGRGRIMLGLVAVGMWRFLQGLTHCGGLTPFPWKRVAITISVPLALGPGFLAIVGITGAVRSARQEQSEVAAALAAADKASADRIRLESAAEREVANLQRSDRVDAQLAKAMEQLSSKQPTSRCDAALVLGRSGAREYVPPLLQVLANDGAGFVRNCAASALVGLGETDAPLAAYQTWVEGSDPDLRRSALIGFGEIGPSTADIALRYLTEEMKSPHADVRYIAVDVLSKLGPAAETLLLVAATDSEKMVRDRANQVLARR